MHFFHIAKIAAHYKLAMRVASICMMVAGDECVQRFYAVHEPALHERFQCAVNRGRGFDAVRTQFLKQLIRAKRRGTFFKRFEHFLAMGAKCLFSHGTGWLTKMLCYNIFARGVNGRKLAAALLLRDAGQCRKLLLQIGNQLALNDGNLSSRELHLDADSTFGAMGAFNVLDLP